MFKRDWQTNFGGAWSLSSIRFGSHLCSALFLGLISFFVFLFLLYLHITSQHCNAMFFSVPAYHAFTTILNVFVLFIAYLPQNCSFYCVCVVVVIVVVVVVIDFF